MKKLFKSHHFILFIIFLSITVASFTISTIARYVASVDIPFNNNGEINESVDFTVNTVFTVKNQNELYAAINQGYSYIQISNELKNPFVITHSPKNLTTDLILDLNGIEIYRHGNDPVFVIENGTRLTITDTSETQRGCIYNPTGSALKISGGTLTVVSGKFECGPRYSEYYSYNHNILSEKSHKRTLVNADAKLVKLYFEDPNNGGFKTEEVRYAPIIKCYNTSYDGNIHHHGNVYFDWDILANAPENNSLKNLKIFADTYCYYTTSEDDSYDDMKIHAEGASWYYSYFVDNDFNYYSHEDDGTEGLTEVTIYGYEKTILNAETHDGVKQEDIDEPSNDFYAAIKMSGGLMDILYGDFFNYFGLNTTACVDMMGGELRIKEGHFSTRIPNATSHVHHAVDAKEDDAAAFDRLNYFNDYYWNTLTADQLNSYPGTKAHQGEGFCILTSGDAKISIGNGNFYASNNNLVHMQGGTLDIGGGSFTKTNTILLDSYNHTDTAIFMHDGNLLINKADYYITGDYARAIRMIDGDLEINNASMEIHGDYTYAVYSTIPGDDKLRLNNIDFYMQSRTEIGRITGIYSAPSQDGVVGAVKVSSSDGNMCKISIDGNRSAGIHSEGGKVYANGCNFDILGKSSSGIYANEGTVEFNGGDLTINSDIGCYGIYAICKRADKNVSVSIDNADINVGYDSSNPQPDTVFDDNNGAGTAASIGVFLASANPDSKVNLTNSNIYSYELGLALSGGSLNISDTDDTANYIVTNRASAIAVSNGNLTFSEGGNYSITSYNTTSSDCKNSYNITIPYLSANLGNYEIKPVLYRNTDGVYVSGGSIHSNGKVSLTHTGLENVYIDEESSTDDSVVYAYNDFTGYVVNSYAIRVVGGNVTFNKGSITANVGGGIYCSATENDGGKDTGTIVMGTPNSTISDIKVSTKGELYDKNRMWYALGYNYGEWESRYSITGGHAIELNGGDITIYNGEYTAAFSNGVLAHGSGEINIHNGKFLGYMGTGNNKVSGKSGPTAFYGLKVLGGATVKIFGGDFDGGNGGAFVTGVDDFNITDGSISLNSTSGKEANVLVYAGNFGSSGTSFHDGFNVYDYANVVFGAYNLEELKKVADAFGLSYSELIDIYAVNASIALNSISANASIALKSTVTIYYGNYSKGSTDNTASRDGIFFDGTLNKNTKVHIYNTHTSPKHTLLANALYDSTNTHLVIYKNTSAIFYE